MVSQSSPCPTMQGFHGTLQVGSCPMVRPQLLAYLLPSKMETLVQTLADLPAQLDPRMVTRALLPLVPRTQSPTLHIRSFLPIMTPKVPWSS